MQRDRLLVRADGIGRTADLFRGPRQFIVRVGESRQGAGLGVPVGLQFIAKLAKKREWLFQQGLSQPIQLAPVLELGV